MKIDEKAPVITRDEIFIRSTAPDVWELLTDIDHWSLWNPDIQKAALNGPLSIGQTFTWKTAGLEITSTIAEIALAQKIAWSGTVNSILGIHEWLFEPVKDGVIIHTYESWSGGPAAIQAAFFQTALDRSIRAWLEALREKAERG